MPNGQREPNTGNNYLRTVTQSNLPAYFLSQSQMIKSHSQTFSYPRLI